MADTHAGSRVCMVHDELPASQRGKFHRTSAMWTTQHVYAAETSDEKSCTTLPPSFEAMTGTTEWNIGSESRKLPDADWTSTLAYSYQSGQAHLGQGAGYKGQG